MMILIEEWKIVAVAFISLFLGYWCGKHPIEDEEDKDEDKRVSDKTK